MRHAGVLLSRSEHAPAGRARRDRGGDRRRSGGVDGARWPPGDMPALDSFNVRSTRPCDPGAPLRRGPGQELPALHRPADRGELSGRRARRHLGRARQRGHRPLRPDAGQADRARRRPRAGAWPSWPQALAETRIAGIETNLDYLRSRDALAPFIEGRHTTRCLATFAAPAVPSTC